MDDQHLICTECGAEYLAKPNGRTRGSGEFVCGFCDEWILAWGEDGGPDYDFTLLKPPDEEPADNEN